jgi:superfamily II DNA or RNA helicase
MLPKETAPHAEISVAMLNAQELAGGFFRVYQDLANRDYHPELNQEIGITDIGTALADGVAEGHVLSATSSGKSLYIAMLAEAAVTAGKRALILVPSIPIGEQHIGVGNGDKTTGLKRFTSLVDDKKVRSHFGNARGNATAQVVVTTYAGFLNEVKNNNARLGTFDLILADECHRSLGPLTSKAVKEYQPDAVRIGFSATPDFADDRRSEEVFGTAIHEYSLRTAIEDGRTAPIRALIFETGHTLVLNEARKDITEKELAPLAQLAERNAAAIEIVEDLVADGRQGIIACVPGGRNAHARLMAGLLSQKQANGKQIRAVEVGGHLEPKEQKARLQAFERGEYDVLTFTKAIEEGWDSNLASFCLNLAPTTSPLRTTQLLGRVLRPHPDGKESIYIDFVDKTSGIAKQQYTALHALDIEDIDVSRVLGSHRYNAVRPPAALSDISHLFDDELYSRFMGSQGKLLREVTIPRKLENPLIRHWEKVLTDEGLPANLPDEFQDEKDMQKYQTAFDELVHLLGRLPLHEEIMEEIGLRYELSKPRLERLSNFAIRCSLEEILVEGPSDENTPRTVMQELLRQEVHSVVKTLTDRESHLINMRFGLIDGDRKTMDEVGREFRLTRERIRQIESATLSKLRHISRSHRLSIGIDMVAEYETDKPVLVNDSPPMPNFGLSGKRIFAPDVPPQNLSWNLEYIDANLSVWEQRFTADAKERLLSTIRGTSVLNVGSLDPDGVYLAGKVSTNADQLKESIYTVIEELSEYRNGTKSTEIRDYDTTENLIRDGLLDPRIIELAYGLPGNYHDYLNASDGRSLVARSYYIDLQKTIDERLDFLDAALRTISDTDEIGLTGLHKVYSRRQIANNLYQNLTEQTDKDLEVAQEVLQRLQNGASGNPEQRAKNLRIAQAQVDYVNRYAIALSEILSDPELDTAPPHIDKRTHPTSRYSR